MKYIGSFKVLHSCKEISDLEEDFINSRAIYNINTVIGP